MTPSNETTNHQAADRLRLASETTQRALPEGADAWIVGGIVRDALLDRPLTDCDIATNGDPAEIARSLAQEVGGSPFELSDEHGCWRVTVGDGPRHQGGIQQWDICRLQGSSIEADIDERDFTINAIALNTATDELVDPTGGVDDLDSRSLRMVSDRAFSDDPLRVLRLTRFAHQLGLVADPQTLVAARDAAPTIDSVAGERIFAELSILLLEPSPKAAMQQLDGVGLIDELLPELAACRGMEQTRFHQFDVYDHTLAVLDFTGDMTRNPSAWGLGSDDRPFSDEERLISLLAAICHDLGKPATRGTHPVTGGPTFMGHDEYGAQLVDHICRRWATSNVIRRSVRKLVHTHLVIGRMLHTGVHRRSAWQFLQQVEPVAAPALVLALADRYATMGEPNKAIWLRRHIAAVRFIWSELERYDRDGIPEPLLDGTEIAEAAGITPGPALGELVAALAEAQAVGDITTRDKALELVSTS